jgi:hypothetical protein
LSQKLSALFVVVLLLVGIVSISSNFALADDKDKNKKQKTLQDYCSTLDDKNGFPALVCIAILNISNSIQGLQDQITHMRLVQFPQTCPTGQVMTGIDNQGKIICEVSTSISQTSAIVALSHTSITVDYNAPTSIIQASQTVTAIVLTPNTGVTVYLNGSQISTPGLSTTSAGGVSFTIPITSAFPVGNYIVKVTDQNGRTGSAQFVIISPPPPPPHALVILNPTLGSIGTDVLITAMGLTPNDVITVSVQGIPVTSGTSNSTGGFSLHYVIPSTINSIPVPLGTYPVSVTDQHGISGSAPFILQ